MQSHMCKQDRPCAVPPHPNHPDPQRRVAENLERSQGSLSQINNRPSDRPLGLNDGTIFAPASYPPHVPHATIRRAALDQPSLQNAINVIVVLVNFQDKAMDAGALEHFRSLFFSSKEIPTGSVTEFYTEVSGGRISVTGEVAGPFTLPHTEEYYARGFYGKDDPTFQEPNLRTMANDAVTLVEGAQIDLRKYDNAGRADGYVDAFVVVHAGTGGEVSGNGNDLWSCKWVLPADREVPVSATGTENPRVYSFLTIPEDVKLGVCVHELGHLLFGWPDLYDISFTSLGIGGYCLMSYGCWGAIGDGVPGTTPTHPSAWCKLQQGWLEVIVDETDSSILLDDVELDVSSITDGDRHGRVHKLWSNGNASGNEYFLIENRAKSGFDRSLPSEGLLVWHVDDSIYLNDDRLQHYKVALMSADGQAKLINTGDGGNPFPGNNGKREFSATTVPNSLSYAGQDTFVAVRNISHVGQTMKMDIAVQSQANGASGVSRL